MEIIGLLQACRAGLCFPVRACYRRPALSCL